MTEERLKYLESICEKYSPAPWNGVVGWDVKEILELIAEVRRLRDLFLQTHNVTNFKKLVEENAALQSDVENSRARELKHRMENDRLRAENEKLGNRLEGSKRAHQAESTELAAQIAKALDAKYSDSKYITKLENLLLEARKHLCWGDDSSETEDLLNRIDSALGLENKPMGEKE